MAHRSAKKHNYSKILDLILTWFVAFFFFVTITHYRFLLSYTLWLKMVSIMAHNRRRIWQHFEKKITGRVSWSEHRSQCCFHVLDVFNKYITWQMYKTSNLSDVKCITFIKCWFKTQAGISRIFSTITALFRGPFVCSISQNVVSQYQ